VVLHFVQHCDHTLHGRKATSESAQAKSGSQESNPVITTLCIIGAKCHGCASVSSEIIKQVLVEALEDCGLKFVATKLLVGQDLFLFGLVHHRASYPLVICIKVRFKE